MEKAYAQALWQMIQAGSTPREAVTLLQRSLVQKGRLALLPKIARAFARIGAREEARNTVKLAVARPQDATRALAEVKKFLAGQNFKEFDLCEEIDASLIGGWRLEGKGILLDASWKKSLLSMYNRATT